MSEIRLNSIKLAGFKSFVDPTEVALPGNLTAVVGPNGCGKSNIIDAVRWVMGESSAKQLRGESLTDVIFNGSTARQPVSQASVELHFDNSSASIGGEYAKFSEIIIRRQVTRDGESHYFINGVRCRRRDITDIFLGTGLGPRSYSIIEQGMISRLIEAKPEELRAYIEEAARISKYKERRRDTELRIQHTRENMARLTDLREEQQKHLDHLQRQAQSAERYKILKQEERVLRAQLHAVRYRDATILIQQREIEIQQLEVQLESCVAAQHGVELELEKQRALHFELIENLSSVQNRYYQVGGDITRLEQSIQHANERQQQLKTDIEQAENMLRELTTHLELNEQQEADLLQQITTLEPECERTASAAKEAGMELSAVENSIQIWQSEWDTFNHDAAQITQQAQVQQTEIRHVEQHLQTASTRLVRLEEEKNRFCHQSSSDEMSQLQLEQADLQQKSTDKQQLLNTLLETISNQRRQNEENSRVLDKHRSHLQTLRGHYASLDALQQSALGKEKHGVADWLKQQGIADLPRLAQQLQVDTGWERAVEIVLDFYLEAICTPDSHSLALTLPVFQKESVSLFDTHKADAFLTASSLIAPTASSHNRIRLLDKIKSPWSLKTILTGVYTAETLSEALEMASSLNPRESVITKEGIWVGPAWLKVMRERDEHTGVLKRERELKETETAIKTAEDTVAQAQAALNHGIETLQQLEDQREDCRHEMATLSAVKADIDAQLRVHLSRVEQAEQRTIQIDAEIFEINQQITKEQEQLSQARSRWQAAMEVIDSHANRREELSQQRTALQQSLDTKRQHARHQQDLAHHSALRLQSITTQLNAVRQACQRDNNQLETLRVRCQQLTQTLEETTTPIAAFNEKLSAALSIRTEVDRELTSLKQQVSEVDFQLQSLDQKRQKAEQHSLGIRTQLESKRIELQGLQVKNQTLVEQVKEIGYDVADIVAELPESSEESSLDSQLHKVIHKVERLGPINLAAIDEFAQQSERKEYLDAQNADLEEALKILEEAIRKIDRETRARFKQTFDQVNKGFQTLFPRIFGGGSASLELTGDDLLDTGVVVMARPPGKRNTTIHLLSGGEKALTAVALVFSIFQLNPAPFCLLDEVDAPLDDANIGRFCTLVKEMSKTIQFIFISHNKLAIEMAQHLTGVTMNEPGVSRLVAVDVEQAMAMAEA